MASRVLDGVASDFEVTTGSWLETLMTLSSTVPMAEVEKPSLTRKVILSFPLKPWFGT